MNPEETTQIKKLLASTTSRAGQQAAMRWLKELLEQDYILDLPPSQDALIALETYANTPHVEDKLQQRALKIYRKYAPNG